MSRGIDYSKWDDIESDDDDDSHNGDNSKRPGGKYDWVTELTGMTLKEDGHEVIDRMVAEEGREIVMEALSHIKAENDENLRQSKKQEEENRKDLNKRHESLRLMDQHMAQSGIFSTDTSRRTDESGEPLTGKQRDLFANAMSSLSEGNTVRITLKDILPADKLLSGVIPGGLKDREEAAAKGKDFVSEGEEDPVHNYLWNLIMKIREGPKHADKLLEVEVFDRILRVLYRCNPDNKYNSMTNTDVMVSSLLVIPTEDGWEMARGLFRDVLDTVFCIGVLHELCRYRAACVELAKHRDGIVMQFLLGCIPSEEMFLIGMALTLQQMNVAATGYQAGMIEQGTIDVMGRLLNGLDKHPELRRKLANQMQPWLSLFETKCDAIELTMKQSSVPKLNHCIELKSSLSKLKAIILAVLNDGEEPPEVWKSTFLVERDLIDDPKKFEDNEVQKRYCRGCSKVLSGKLMTCAKCKTVLYCSRECQISDWKTHKKDCVKHRGAVPSDTSWHGGDIQRVLRMVEANGIGNSKNAKKEGEKK